MRTQQYLQVEEIVNKYETLASNTDEAKKAMKNWEHEWGFSSVDFMRLNYGEQLIARIYELYELRAGAFINPDVKKKYSEAASFYISELLNAEEEAYLVENFDVFVDYVFEHFDTYMVSSPSLSGPYDEPYEWCSIVPYLLNNKTGRVFVPNSSKGREFVGLNNIEITVGYGYQDAAIRALAYGYPIRDYKLSDNYLFSDIEDGLFDVLIADMHNSFVDISEHYDNLLRIVREGGDVLLCVSKETMLSVNNTSLRRKIIDSKILQEVILLPSGNILLHCVKKEHNSVVMCDASNLSTRGSREDVIDVDLFIKEMQLSNTQERDDIPIIRSFLYEEIKGNMLLPVYYLRFPNNGTPLSQVANICEDKVLTDECSPEEKVVTVNHLSNVFTKGVLKVDELTNVRTDRLRAYFRVEGPAVIMAVSDQNISIGYTTDKISFLVPGNLYVLTPRKDVDISYLACMLLSEPVKEQLKLLVYGKGISAALASHWNEYTLVDLSSVEEQHKTVQNVILQDYATQERFKALQEKGFKHAIRLRKHALSQNVSAFDSLFHSLEHCMTEHKGELKAGNLLSPFSQMTVADAFSILRSNLILISERVNKLTDEQDWGSCEAIEPQQFIENYESLHSATDFRFKHLWEEYETNSFSKDLFYKKTGKLLFHKGESMNTAWFPKRALTQVFDNIVSNAFEHGFTDKSRKDYVIQTSWTTDGLNMLIKIANNGNPIPSELNTDLVMEYGYTTALNQRGHAGIGGAEIAEIMHKFGGNVSVISTPDKYFTVTYVLALPLASIF